MNSVALQSTPASTPQPFVWDAGSAIFGGIWVALITDTFFRLVGGCGSDSLEQTAINATSFGGTLANTFHWADSIGLLSLGSYVPLAQALGFGATGVLSFFGTLESWRNLSAVPEDAEDVNQQKFMHLLTLASRVTMLAWSILSLGEFLVGAPVLPLLASTLLVSSFLLLVASMVAKSRLARQQEAPAIQN